MFSLSHHIDLTPLNTLGLCASAESFLVIEHLDSLIDLQKSGLLAQGAFTLLGGGSNVVLREDVAGLVLLMRIGGRALVDEDEHAWYVRAGAGEVWHDFVGWTLAQGWGGLENLALIPGTVGASPVQNIGAYGVEVGEHIHQVETFDTRSGRLQRFSGQACLFAYRESIFKSIEAKHYIVTAVTFKLSKNWQPVTTYAEVASALASRGVLTPSPQQVAEVITAIRSTKLPDPKVIGNAGSFFKNPVVDTQSLATLQARFPSLPYYLQDGGRAKIPAAWLIDQAGWKGKNLGSVGMYEKQALVLVNRGGAKGKDVLHLAQAVQFDVWEKFGIGLEIEPVVI